MEPLTLIIIGGFIIYFLPTMIGFNKKNVLAIFTLNLLLGWTFIGWVVAFVWSLMEDG